MPCTLNGRWRRFVIALITSCGSSFHSIGLALKKRSVCHTDKLYCCSKGFSGVGTISHRYSLGASLQEGLILFCLVGHLPPHRCLT